MPKFQSALVLAVLLVLMAAPSQAFLYRALGGSDAAQDIASKINEIIARTERAARSVIGEGNAALEARLDQVDGIVDDALDQLAAIPADAEERVLNVLRETEASLLELERQIFADVKQAIFEVECAATRFTLGELQAGLGSVGDVVGTGKIKINPPLKPEIGFFCWLNPWCGGEPEFEIADNFERTAIEVRTYMLDALSKIEDDDPAYAIPETYNYLALLARRTTCFVGVEENPWVEDHIRYTGLAQDWNKYVKPERK